MYYENLTQTTHETLQIYFDKFYCGMSQQAQKKTIELSVQVSKLTDKYVQRYKSTDLT